MSKILKSKM